ncbi:hypothetical protein [Kineococcus glutinatus]|uniref:Uncharacterized protein n=1 Tax=Kineococcus glutinatus TaxID=1070872 RepID=A0ABP9H962_9ACTN
MTTSGAAAGGEPEDGVLDSAMATGNDEGEAGEPGPAPFPDLGPDDPEQGVESTAEAIAAAHDDAPLPRSVLPPAVEREPDPRVPRFSDA